MIKKNTCHFKPLNKYIGYLCTVKGKLDLKNLITFWSVSGLIVLLLLSPCKVRNHIQSELGLLQTEVSNKSISTLRNSCNTFGASIKATVVSKASARHFPAFLSSRLYSASAIIDLFNTSISSYKGRNSLTSFVPYYILYRNFKHFL